MKKGLMMIASKNMQKKETVIPHDYPDQCIRFIQKQNDVADFCLEDISKVVFNEKYFCFSAKANYKGKKIIGIGTDQDKFTAASKCMSEFFERYCYQKYFGSDDVSLNAFGSAFHWNEDEACKTSFNELIERTTTGIFCLKKDSSLTIRPVKLPKDLDEVIRQTVDEPITVCLFCLEYFPEKVVCYVEISSQSDPNVVGNGAAYCRDDMQKALVSACLESMRRYRVMRSHYKQSKYVNRNIGEIIKRRDDFDDSFQTIKLIPDFELKAVAFKKQISDIGYFYCHYFEHIPRLPFPQNEDTMYETRFGERWKLSERQVDFIKMQKSSIIF